jgi:prolyl-tRNA synthetase
MARDERGVTPQSEDFSSWYNELVTKAQLVERGPARGTMVIRPYGYRVWELLQAELDGRIKDTGHENAYFPLLIPESYLKREAEHVEGFAPELAVVTHGDDKGLVLPPKLAPHQVVIVPIGRGQDAEAVHEAVRELARRLKNAGIRAHIDDRPQFSPGFKFNEWELRGAPLRLEIGPRDLAGGTALLATRLGDEGKTAIGLDTAPETLAAALDDFQAFLLRRATDFRESRTATADSRPEFAEAVAAGWARTLHCGRPSCEEEIKAETAATPRCVPFDAPAESGTCVRCDAPSAYGKRVLFARAY